VISLPVAQIVEAYEQGDSFSILAKRYGVSSNTIRNRLIEAGCKLRKQGHSKNRKMTPIDLSEVDRLRSLGWDYRRIGSWFGVCDRTIRNRLKART